MTDIFRQCALALLTLYRNNNESSSKGRVIACFNRFIGRDRNVRALMKNCPNKILLSEDMINLTNKLQILIAMAKTDLIAFPDNITRLDVFECPNDVTDEDLTKLAPHFCKLKELKLFIDKGPFEPSISFLQKKIKKYPPNYLHDSWKDFLYWDTELEP